MEVNKIRGLEHWKKKYDEATEKSGIKKETNKGLMYMSTPKEIESWIRKNVPEGKLATTKIIADAFTKKYKVDFTCPLTTGIFFSIATNVAEKLRLAGETDILPYWRIIKPNGSLYEKYLGEFNSQKELLEVEGFKIEKDPKTGVEKVKDWKNYLI